MNETQKLTAIDFHRKRQEQPRDPGMQYLAIGELRARLHAKPSFWAQCVFYFSRLLSPSDRCSFLGPKHAWNIEYRWIERTAERVPSGREVCVLCRQTREAPKRQV